MKILKLTILLSACMLMMLACDSNYDGGNYKEHKNAHDSGSENSNPSDSRSGVNQGVSDNGKTESVRMFWQKPKVVMNKMGDLKDKVVADIGAGPYGFFTIQIAENTEVQKIIAIDIDKEAIQFIENQKITYRQPIRNRIETRLAEPDDPKLKDGEADVVLIVNTYIYFEDPVAYFKNLMKGIPPNGKLVIVDFKKRNTPEGPPLSFRTAIGKVEQVLEKAGYINIESDDQTLDYQYIVIAQPGEVLID